MSNDISFPPRLRRLLTWFVWGDEVFKAPDPNKTGTLDTYYFFWIPWILPHVGALFGALSYVLFISLHHEEEEEEETQRRKAVVE